MSLKVEGCRSIKDLRSLRSPRCARLIEQNSAFYGQDGQEVQATIPVTSCELCFFPTASVGGFTKQASILKRSYIYFGPWQRPSKSKDYRNQTLSVEQAVLEALDYAAPDIGNPKKSTVSAIHPRG